MTPQRRGLVASTSHEGPWSIVVVTHVGIGRECTTFPQGYGIPAEVGLGPCVLIRLEVGACLLPWSLVLTLGHPRAVATMHSLTPRCS